MKFGPVPVGEAAGAIAAHSLKVGELSVRKGAPITPELADELGRARVDTVVTARLEPGDVGEDEAALRLAQAVAGAGLRLDEPFTGRANLHATTAGVLLVDKGTIDRANTVDEAVTVATLPAFKPVVAGEMVATVKIIPYGVSGRVLDDAVAAVAAGSRLAVAPYGVRSVGAVSTLAPNLKASVVDKTIAALRARLAPTGAALVADARCAHEADALATELARQAGHGPELIVVFGASAVADRQDVIPTAIEAAGGAVDHLGMPVDPGNLLLLGRIGPTPVIGAPGCARSPKENGFDWILHRLLARLAITRADIAGLGVGGLLMEIVSRPQPRAGGESEDDA